MRLANFTPQEIEKFLQEFFDVVGTRQYIGARYVPIFGRKGEDTVEWDNIAPYEPLSVVMHEGISYVSRQYVPRDVDITNTDYWVQTYRFNAQVEQYRQEVLGFQSQINDKVPFPDSDFYPKFGALGQVLSTLADGTTKWEDPVVPSDEQAEEVITTWLDAHPEATTTVQDGAITTVKLANGSVTDEKLAQSNGVLSEVANLKNALDSNTITLMQTYYKQKYQSMLTGSNLYDPSTVLANSYFADDGSIMSQVGYYISDYIPLFGNDIWVNHRGSTATVDYIIYDEDFNIIEGKIYKVQSKAYTYENGDAYIRFVFNTNPRAFYGSVDYGSSVPFLYDPQKDAKDVKTNVADIANTNDELEAFKASVNNTFDDIAEQTLRDVFQSFDTHISSSSSTTFRAFATRYSYVGTVKKVSVNAKYFSSSTTMNVDVILFDGDFQNVLASKSVTVTPSSSVQWIEAEFDEEITLNGNFYVCVKTGVGNSATTPNDSSTRCTATSTGATTNKYLLSSDSGENWQPCGTTYCLDVILYGVGYVLTAKPETILYVGNQDGCDFETIQDAIDSILDDSAEKPYIIIIMPGTYERFKLGGLQNARYISLFGYDETKTIVFDNLGNYDYPPAEIRTYGTIQGISFINKTDAQHHTQAQGRTTAYAVHSDFGTCEVKFINCYFYSNAGAAVGLGTHQDTSYSFENCTFISENDGTYGATGHGALFCHTEAANNITNQNLVVRNSIAKATGQVYGSRLAVIGEYTGGSYNYELQNFGSFGNAGAAVSLTDPDGTLLSDYNFNNVPNELN